MSRDKSEIAATELGSPQLPDLAELVGRDQQELWFSLARRPWRSAVLVPAENGLRADELAASLASIGRRLGFTQVSSVVAEQIDFATVGQLTAKVAAQAQAGAPAGQGGAQLIVSIPPVVIQPLGVAVARAADAVVICLAMGHTRLQDVQRTIDMVGRERIRGAVLLPVTRA